jgi:hypothetical protein
MISGVRLNISYWVLAMIAAFPRSRGQVRGRLGF